MRFFNVKIDIGDVLSKKHNCKMVSHIKQQTYNIKIYIYPTAQSKD